MTPASSGRYRRGQMGATRQSASIIDMTALSRLGPRGAIRAPRGRAPTTCRLRGGPGQPEAPSCHKVAFGPRYLVGVA